MREASADLIAVSGNPVERIQALAEIRLVVTDGKMIVNRLEERRPS